MVKTEKSTFVLPLLYAIKYGTFLCCCGFVLNGWRSSYDKYKSEQTAVSTTIRETETFRYPSVTFCREFRDTDFDGDGDNLLDVVKQEAGRLGTNSWRDLNEEEIIRNLTIPRQYFLSSFMHAKDGNLDHSLDILNNDSLWTITIPHAEYSGICSTYDPRYESLPGDNYGIRFTFKFPDWVTSEEDKARELTRVRMYLHLKDQFTFYEQDDRPNCNLIDTAYFKYKTEMSISLDYKVFKRFSRPGNECNNHPDYNFNQCLEQTHSKLRGCQPPWYYFDNVDVPVCDNLEDILSFFAEDKPEWTHPRWNTNGLAHDTNCTVPCESSQFVPEFSFYEMDPVMKQTTDYAVNFWFKAFNFQYDEEYILCDWTCLVGETGGNLGFFLGGSIFLYARLFLSFIDVHIVQKLF